MNKTKVIILFAFLLAVICIALVMRVNHNLKFNNQAYGFFNNIADVGGIEVKTPSEHFTLKYSDKNWQVTSPFIFPADTDMTEDFLLLLYMLNFSGVLASDEKNLPRFGLNDGGEAAYIITSKTGQLLSDFCVGKDAPDESGKFVLFNNLKEVRKANELKTIPLSLAEFLSKEISAVPRENLAGFTFEDNGAFETFIYENGVWYRNNSPLSDSHTEVLNVFAAVIADAKAEKVFHKNGEIISFDAHRRITVATKDDAGFVLQLGDLNGEFAIKRSNEGRVIFVPDGDFANAVSAAFGLI